ncbi:lyase family protein [Streptomyces sp. NPDC004539]|uniref:argininosuccinate lyase n=1 Tax=Streptomyces sp. NPDC004539 TaxID=3154280 RepID=UPI0033A65C3D
MVLAEDADDLPGRLVNPARTAPISGRVSLPPSALLHEETLAPQFAYEAEHLLPWYVAVEKVLVVEYGRLGVVPEERLTELGRLLSEVTAESLRADPDDNMSDIAFALERHVERRLTVPVPAWHVDRSRNDLQACAQLLFARDQLQRTAAELTEFARTVHRVAGEHLTLPMPGHTHLQTAQVITPGFYLAAVGEQIVHTLGRLLATYDGIDLCPLGAGAMAGQELPWDRDDMAELLGFRAARPHALPSVASRDWAVEVTAEFSVLGVPLSRFATDLMNWGSGASGFVDLPDDMSGISSAMPQKKNFPVLERVRGRTAHLGAFHLDVVLGQRNTPYSNSVEVSKEAGAHLLAAFTAVRSVLRMFRAVLENLRFDAGRMRAVCEREYLGGFTLANLLTLDEGVPWRRAQVIAGRYIVAAVERGVAPSPGDAGLLRGVAAGHGVELADPGGALALAFDVEESLRRKRSAGSAHPDAVREVLAGQRALLDERCAEWERRGARVRAGLAETDHRLGLAGPGSGGAG